MGVEYSMSTPGKKAKTKNICVLLLHKRLRIVDHSSVDAYNERYLGRSLIEHNERHICSQRLKFLATDSVRDSRHVVFCLFIVYKAAFVFKTGLLTSSIHRIDCALPLWTKPVLNLSTRSPPFSAFIPSSHPNTASWNTRHTLALPRSLIAANGYNRKTTSQLKPSG